MVTAIVQQIPEICPFTNITPIHKGFSADEKYIVQRADGEKMLLKLFSTQSFETKRQEYEILEKMAVLEVKCSTPICIGQLAEYGYMVTSYLEGEDAEEGLQAYSDQLQFQMGFEAGEELRKIHQLTAPPDVADWYDRKSVKHRRYIDAYLKCGVKIEKDTQIIQFIEDNMHLMKERPNMVQHDDYHAANLIIHDGQFAGVIDFDRYDWGDPVHEFLKIGMFSRTVSIPFSIGQIKGYFQREPDEHFWRLYALYLAMSAFSAIVWTVKTTPDTLHDMLEKVALFLADHDHFQRIVPKWYD